MLDPRKAAQAWVAAWNSHDLDRILGLYAQDCEMSSPKIAALGKSASGALRGVAKLRDYWGAALERQPNLHFKLDQVFGSPNSIVVRYRDHHGHEVCEYLRYDGDGRIVQGAAHHEADGAREHDAG